MAGITHGALRRVQINGRIFSVAGDNAGTRKLGGRENEVAKNGDGTIRILQTEVAWSMADVQLATDEDGQAFLQDIADAGEEVPMQFTFASQTIMAGLGIPTGEVPYDGMTGLVAVTLGGSGKLAKQ